MEVYVILIYIQVICIVMCNVAGVAPLRKRHGSAVTVSRAADCSNILPLLAHGAAAENGGWSAAVCAMHQAQRIKVTATV